MIIIFNKIRSTRLESVFNPNHEFNRPILPLSYSAFTQEN